MRVRGGFRSGRALAAATLAALVCLAAEALAKAALGSEASAKAALSDEGTAQTTEEVRALWVLRTSLTSPDRITALVRTARDHGFNTLLVQVRGRGDAYYRGALEPVPGDLLRQPVSFDPLASVIDAAKPAGLRVHAWMNVNLISSAVDLPVARDHIIYRRPDWLMVPRDIAQELAAVDSGSPAYVGKLARWTRGQPSELEGLYASPIVPDAAAHVEAVVRDLTRRYPVDGIHLDYARYPNDQFDYSRAAIGEFRRHLQPRLTAATRRELDDRQTDDLFAYPDAYPREWREFRLARMTALVARLRSAIKSERPSALVTAATTADMQDALTRRLQDWRGWLEARLIDAVCPMAYTPEASRFADQIAAARAAAGSSAVWAGIGAYRLTPAQTIENIQTARRLGASGVVLFSYDSLTNPRQAAPDYLALVARGAFAIRPIAAGSR